MARRYFLADLAPEASPLQDRFSKDFYAQLFATSTQLLLPLATYPVVTKALGPEGLGMVHLTESICQLVVLLAGLGMPIWGLREAARLHPNGIQQARLWKRIQTWQLLLLLPALASLAGLLWVNGLPQPLIWIGLLNAFFALLNAEWLLLGRQAFAGVAIRSGLLRLLAGFVIVLTVKAPGDHWVYYGCLVGVVAGAGVYNFGYAIRLWRRHPSPADAPTKPFKLNLYVYGYVLFFSLDTALEATLLNWLSDDKSLGWFAFSIKMVQLSTGLALMMGNNYFGKLSQGFAQAPPEVYRRDLLWAQRHGFFLSVPLTVFFLFFAPGVVAVLAAPGFEPAAGMLRTMAAVPLLAGMVQLGSKGVMLPQGRDRSLFWIVFGGAISTTVCLLLLVPRWGGGGAAWAVLITELYLAIACLMYVGKQGLLRLDIPYVLRCLVLAAVLAGIGWGCTANCYWDLLTLLCVAGGYAIMYFGCQFFIFRDPLVKALLPWSKQGAAKNDSMSAGRYR